MLSTSNWRVETTPPEGPGPWIVSATSTANQDSTDGAQVPRHICQAQVVNGIVYPPWCPQRRWDFVNSEVSYRDSDILIVTYPKCGTTWAEQCVLLLTTKGDTSRMNPAHKNVYSSDNPVGKIWVEACLEQDPQVQHRMGREALPLSKADFEAAAAPRVIKSHAPVQNLLGTNGQGVTALPKGIKVIVVSRNPLDACVSSYYHAFNPAKSGWPFDAWASVWLEGKVPHGSWFSWVKDWHHESQLHPENVYWLQYESLQSNASNEIAKIASFLNMECDEELIKKVANDSSFESMKAQAMQNGGDANNHLRKGVSGDWRNHFDDNLSNEFVERYKSEMKGSGLVYSLGGDVEDLVA